MEPNFRVLSEEDIHRIDSASVGILSGTGTKMMNHKALEVLRRVGASVNERAEMARIPEQMIREALNSAKRRVVLFSRDGKNDIDLSSA